MYLCENINISKMDIIGKNILKNVDKKNHWYGYWKHIDFDNSYVYYKKDKRTVISSLVLYKSNLKIKSIKNVYFVRSVGVNKKYRSRGECHKLLQYLFNNLPNKGKNILLIEVASGNIPAYKCYIKHFKKSRKFQKKMKIFNEKQWKMSHNQHKFLLKHNPKLLFEEYKETSYEFNKDTAKFILLEKKI